MIQGLLTGIGFYVFGVPNPALWGSFAVVAALIPGIGTSLVIVPGVLYLFFVNTHLHALGMLIWGILAVGLIDNFLGPMLVNRGVNIHPFLILLSVMGRLAILIREPADYEVYTYFNGRRRKIKPKSVQIKDRLLNFLKDKKHGISIGELLGHSEINDDFLELKANFVIPFIFRERIFGFLAVTNIPSPEDLLNLKVLASKSAIAVYNHILSSQVVLHKKYKREFEIANRKN
jgi:hypothetical protein